MELVNSSYSSNVKPFSQYTLHVHTLYIKTTVCVCVCVCARTCVCLLVCMYVCMYVCGTHNNRNAIPLKHTNFTSLTCS